MKTLFKGILIPAFLSMIACTISFTLSYGQGAPSLDAIGPIVNEMIPPSPEAAAFGKYGAMPVSQYTGIPNISIPLYSLQYKGISVPIGLSYHAGGFRVTEDASRVGLGWTVNAGGLISRVVRGNKDEKAAEYGYSNLAGAGYNSLSCTDRDLVESVALGEAGADGQPDQFSFNFLGNSGKFFFTPTGEVKVQACNSLVTLTPTITQQDIVAWTVLDANGFTYIFDKYETSQSKVYYNGTPKDFSDPTNTSWYLTEIISPLQDKVSLTYKEVMLAIPARDFAISESFYHLDISKSEQACTDNQEYFTRSTTHMDKWVVLSEINTPMTKIIFEDGIARQDNPGTASLGEIFIKDNKSQDNIKSILFSQSHFMANCSGLSDCYRLRLDSITVRGYNDQQQVQDGEKYKFTYNSNQLPSRGSFEQDHWGFYNANGQDMAANPTLLPAMQVFGGSYSGANREPNAAKMMACMISSIQYPTGGRTEFIFEPNTYSRSGGQVFPPKIGGGVRIKQIKNISGNGNPDEITQYSYIDQNDPSLSSGKINSPLEYLYDRTTYSETTTDQLTCYFKIRESSSQIPIVTTQGSIIGYDRVEEKKISATNSNGKTVSYFISPMDVSDVLSEIAPDDYTKTYVRRNNDWMRGMMEKEEIFDESGFLVKETEYDYSYSYCGMITGLSSSIFKQKVYTGNSIDDEYFCYTNDEQFGWAHLDQVRTTTYTPGNSNSFVSTETNYTYNSKGQTRSSSIVNSDGTIHTSEAYYIGEDDPNNPGTKLGIPEMWDPSNLNFKHILSPLVYSRKLTNGVVQNESTVDFVYYSNVDAVLLNQQKLYPSPGIPNPVTTQYFYDDEGMITGSQQELGPGTAILRSREKGLISAKVINALYEDVAYSSFDIGVDKDPDNGYRRVEGRWEVIYPNDPAGPNNSGGGWSSAGAKTGIGQFDLNTQRELHTKVESGGTYTLSFWAKKNNPINITVPSSLVLTETAYDGWTLYVYELTLAPDQTLVLEGAHQNQNYIDELRLHPKEAQMTSVCYDLKLRIHTMTDPNNRSVKYTYDAFGRLKQVRDHNGNLLSENEYLYYYE